MSRSHLRPIRRALAAGWPLAFLLAAPVLLSWAARGGRPDPTRAGHSRMDETASPKWLRTHPPLNATARPEGLTPFGKGFKAAEARDPRGLISTNIGHINLKKNDALNRVPAEFRASGPGVRANGKGSGQEGVNIVQIREASLKSLGYDRIAQEVGEIGRILGVVPDRGLLVKVHGKDLDRLAGLESVEAMGPYHPAYKMDPLIGETSFIQRARALDHNLDLQVALWQGEDGAAAKGRLASQVGEANVSDYSIDGTVFRVKATRGQLAKLAQDGAVRHIAEIPEMKLMNSEVPIILMIGNTEESFNLARPFHDLGIDGGGLGAAGLPSGERVNNGSAQVPPQIVVVTDNGITADAVHFSQTATQVFDLGHAFPATNHRKIHSIQNVEDGGNSCDALLSGSNTHGNVVAGIIAGAPGDFGLTFCHAIDPADGLPNCGLSLDALAKGSRIIMQDAANTTRCLSNELIEVGGDVAPGNIADRLSLAVCPRGGGTGACSGVVGGGDEAHLHVMPFGVPNFDNILGNPQNGTYTLEAQQIDRFLVNNRDYMVFSPVGSQGIETPADVFTGIVWPDLFDGTATDDDPNTPRAPQIPPPATAKNSVTVGASLNDAWTSFGGSNSEEDDFNITSHGPATQASLRTAPLVMAVGYDGSGFFVYPLFQAAATNRSRDNDNSGTVENEIDEQNGGTSFAAGFMTAAGAIIRDYFAQGFYPTATRQTADRMPKVSGSLVRAALVAGSNFLDEYSIPDRTSTTDRLLANTRGTNLGTVSGVAVGVIGNNAQGYGRPVLDQVLPLSNYPPTRGLGLPDTVEYPAAGLIVYDMLGTGEAPINNLANTQVEKTFEVNGVNTVVVAGTRYIANGQLRVALSWPDPPSPVGGVNGGGALINDLDLELESPGPDGLIGTPGDNVVYDGNVYIQGQPCCAGQWSQGRPTGQAAVHDTHNNIEAAHLSSAVSASLPNGGNQLVTGTWKVRVRRGSGGAVAGQISLINGNEEDGNGNGRLDAGEDADGDGLLDAGGQPFALVIAGPVMASGQSQSWNGTSHTLPGSSARLNKYQYSCSDTVVATVLDPGAASAAAVSADALFQVVNAAGAVLDEERGVSFAESFGGSGDYVSSPLPARLGSPAVKYNGVLEGDNGQALVLRYTDSPRSSESRARFQCTPSILQWSLDVNGRGNPPSFIGGGCDGDQFLDAGERVTYSIALLNFGRTDDLNDVVATLSPAGPGAGAVRVLDSPKSIGRLPGGQRTGITFSIAVDAAAANALAVANRRVDLVLQLDGGASGARLSRVTYTFGHVINADAEALHYSTDFPAGGREVRDFNRNLQIDRADTIDPFQGVFWPDEDVTFSTLFAPRTVGGKVSNTLGEDLNDNGVLDPGEDVIPNGRLDRGILAFASGPSAGDKVPWNFDTSDGGWFPLRSSFSKAAGMSANPVWEYKGGGVCVLGPTPGKACFSSAQCGTGGTCAMHTGICGFQTARADPDISPWFQNGGAGIWHTGDGDPATPDANANACDGYPFPTQGQTPDMTEIYFDVLHSPIIAKVNQVNDPRGFPYTVEFQRLGFNMNIQTSDYSGGSIDLDNDIDSDARNCLLCMYIYTRFPDLYTLAVFHTYNQGINPVSSVSQRTFGPLEDPDHTFAQNRVINGDETGFTGFTANTNPDSGNPIPTADPDFLPYPIPGAPQVCVPGCAVPAECCEQNTVAGPERNFDMSLLDYEDGQIVMSIGPGQPEPIGAFSPGSAGTRWQIGLGFYAQENNASRSDYGIGFDDPILEWDEVHPLDESAFVPVHAPACSRFGGAGQPAGQPCATLAIDRLSLYECNETVEISVNDPRRSAQPSVTVFGVTDSDNISVPTGVIQALHPRKSFTIPAVAGQPGFFRGQVVLGSLFDNPDLLLAGVNDSNMTFYYLDPECDGDGDGSVGENSFGNLDNDGITAPPDNCPFDYNPPVGGVQPDGDADGVGNLCDNCPGVSNPRNPETGSQPDSDADGVGDACDFDDIDFDGRVNSVDNCPDVYNPTQVPAGGGSTRGAACSGSGDRDNDGVQDRLDKCVRTADAAQTDSDNDGIGNACDGDCLNPRPAILAVGSCNLINETSCSAALPCPNAGTCSNSPTVFCYVNQDCGGGGATCGNFVTQTCQRLGLVNDGSCGTVQDDADGDGVPDSIDTCPVTPNPPIIPGTFRQADADRDGRGDACDPPQTVDDDNDGLPDDAVSFTTQMACRKLPLPSLVVLPSGVRDLNGDHDAFADAGEVARMTLFVKNNSAINLTGVTLILGSGDPDIGCITKGTVVIPSLPAGVTVDTASPGINTPAGAGEFEFVVSQGASTTNPTDPAKGDFAVTLSSNEAVGTATRSGIRLLLDLDVPAGGIPPRVAGHDNRMGTADDGIVREDFDTNRNGNTINANGDPQFDLSSLCQVLPGPDPAGPTGCAQNTPGALNDTIGVWVSTAPGGINVLSAVGCAGFFVPPQDPACVIDPDNDMDWHIHCPPGALQATCPNSTPHQTPVNDGLAYDGNNSLHWGYHLLLTDRTMDTTRFRQLAAFMTNPINLTPLPVLGDLELSFFHIAAMMDNNWSGVPIGQANDYGDVQIQLDRNPNAAVDDWGVWDKLAPFENVYDHIPYIWSYYRTAATYCNLTPADTGNAPYAPRGVRETLCYPLGVWSSCGNPRDTTGTFQCPGPGAPGSVASSTGALWVQSRFSLSTFQGQRVRIRWIAQSWEFDCCDSSYDEVGSWVGTTGDEGWYLDDIAITGALQAQAAPLADTKTPWSGACPAKACDATQGDSGFNVSLQVTEDLADGIVVAGEKLLVSAAGTSNPGGCVGGGTQYRFFRDNLVAQDWSSTPSLVDTPSADSVYRLQVRCSVDATCTSSATASASNSRSFQVYSGDGNDIALSLSHDRLTGVTTLSWPSRVQTTAVSGFDVFRGTQTDDGLSTTAATPDAGLSTLAPLSCNVANGAPGTSVSVTTSLQPATNASLYFLAGHNPVVAGGQAALGRRGDGTLRPLAPSCP
jgi:hypothetical protein